MGKCNPYICKTALLILYFVISVGFQNAQAANLALDRALARRNPATTDQLIVRFKKPVTFDSAAARASGSAPDDDFRWREVSGLWRSQDMKVQALHNRFKLRKARPLHIGHSESNGKTSAQGRINSADSSQVWVLQFDAPANTAEAEKAYAANASVEWAEPNYIGSLCWAPSDPLYANSKADYALIDVEGAWQVQRGSSATLAIALVDSGVDTTHPDLAGVVDLARSRNFIEGNARVFDDIGHGTRMASLIGAKGNNGEGSAGVAFGCKIISLDIATSAGVITVADAASAVTWAASHGAQIINLSLRFSAYSQVLEDACNEARNAGCLLIAAAGNENQGEAPVYPASYDSVVGVGAILDDGSQRAPWSNYNGSNPNLVELVAPGETLFSCIPGGQYNGSFGSGTSFAVALVSGTACLLKSKNPQQSMGAIRKHMRRNAFPLDIWAGNGRIDAGKALREPMAPQISIESVIVDDAKSLNAGNDADGYLDAGEVANLKIRLRNEGGDVMGLSGTLSESDPEISLTSSTAVWGNLAYNGPDAETIPTSHTAIFKGLRYTSSSPVSKGVPSTLTLTAANGPFSANLALMIKTEKAFTLNTASYFTTQTLTANRAWEITGNQSFNAGLIVEPGTVIKVAPGISININGGALRAFGTAAKPILFTRLSPSAQNWGRIYIKGGSSNSELEYCTVEHGQGVLNESARARFRHCTFRRNAGCGLQWIDIPQP